MSKVKTKPKKVTWKASRNRKRKRLQELYRSLVAEKWIPPPQQFNIGDIVSVPAEVHPSRQARIVGCEFGNSYSRKTNHGWVYYLAFAEGGMAWEASEGELVKWQEVSGGN